MQLGALAYDPMKQVPGEADERAGRRLIDTLSRVPGDVYMPYHGYLPVLAGKESHAHAIAVLDVMQGGGANAARLQDAIDTAIRERRFAAIVSDSSLPEPRLEGRYVRQQPLFADRSAFFPVTGVRTRPESLYVPGPGPASR